jgi:hypothetical protein
MFRPKGRVCQSCGMPLSKDPLGGGSNADGSSSSEYCSHCYRKGVFTAPHITVEEMMKLVEGKLRSMHFPGFLARRFAREVPTLRRWRGKAPRPAPQGRPSELQPRA